MRGFILWTGIHAGIAILLWAGLFLAYNHFGWRDNDAYIVPSVMYTLIAGSGLFIRYIVVPAWKRMSQEIALRDLNKYKALKESGVISTEEYERKAVTLKQKALTE